MTGRTLRELTDDVVRVSAIYAERNFIRRDADWYVLKLAEEAGELVAEHLRATGRARVRPADESDAIAEEAADLLAHVLLFCQQNGIDAEAALERKWFKYLPEQG